MNQINPVFKVMLTLIVLTSSVTQVFARPELGPPSIQLRTNISNIAHLKLIAKDDNSLTFLKIKDLHNKAPNKIKIRVNQATSDSLQTEQSYLVGYIALKTLKPSKNTIPRPGGPVFMNLPGASPAVFADNPDIEKMLTWQIEQSLKSPKEMLPIILNGLFNLNAHSRSFFITELITRPKLLSTTEAQAAVKKLLLDPTLSWSDKGFIMTYAGLDQQFKSNWFCQWSNNTLLYTSTQLDLQGQEAGLIRALLNNQQSCDNTITTTSIPRWINSNHSGVVESAIKALRAIDINLTIQLVAAKQHETHLSDSLRMIHTNYLKRLNNEINQNNQKLN